MNANHGLSLENPAYFDRLDEAHQSHWWSAAMWRIASSWLDYGTRGLHNLTALDVGCGSGCTLDRLRDRPEITTAVGLDPNAYAVDRASSKSQSAIRASALHLPFSSAIVDVITCFDVFQHLPIGCDHRAASELCRVVRPGGVVLVRANGRGLWPDPEITDRLFRLSELVSVIQNAGLIVMKSSYLNCLPAVATEVVGRLRKSPESGHPAGRGLRLRAPSPWKNRLMGTVAGLEFMFAGRLGQRLPIGHSTMVLARRPSAGACA